MRLLISFCLLTMISTSTLLAKSEAFPPSAPTATAATGLGTLYFNANWTAVSGATSYYIDVSTSNTFSSFVSGFNNRLVSSISGSSTTYATITGGITAGNTYYYRVRAADGSGSSASSNVITVVMVPATPVALQETNVGATTFQANWNAASGATSYTVEYSLSNTFGTIYGSQTVTTTSASGYSFATATIYYYRVKAVNASGASTYSTVISAGTSATVPVATSATSVSGSSFTATWNAASGATGYAIDVATSYTFAAGTFVPGYQNTTVSTIAGYTATSVPVTGLSPNTIYYYRLRSLGANGPSANSNMITTTSGPDAPVATAASNIQAVSFLANWNPAGVNDYRIDVSTNASFSSFVVNNQSITGAQTSYTVSGLTEGTTHYYRVRAVNANGTSVNSNTISCTPVLAAPVATASTNIQNTSFFVNWNQSAGATGYYFDISTSSNFSTYIYQNVSSSSFAGFTGNPDGSIAVYNNIDITTNTYYYRIRAVNANGTSPNSNVVTVWQFPPAPVAGAPTNISVSGFTANWSSVASAVDYRLDVATDPQFNDLLAGYNNQSVTATNASINGLSLGKVYYYRVRTVNPTGTSANSNVVRVATVNSFNLVKKTAVTRPGLITHNDFINTTGNSKNTIWAYIDGLGRPVQSVSQKQSPGEYDIVQPISYDGFGRESRKYLPYVSTGNAGNYQDNALGLYNYSNSAQLQYYQGTANTPMDNRPFSESIFESSPLNRQLQVYGAGEAWGPLGQNKYTSFNYTNNLHGTGVSATTEKIIAWTISSGLPIRRAVLAGHVETGGYFSSRQLSVKQTSDEEGHVIREYTNNAGQVLLKKVQVGAITNLNSTTDWALTYYIYDIYGNLRFVLPPELSKKIHEAADTYVVTTTDLDNWAFQYKYDALKRMTEKQVPGAGPVFMVYDKRDRIVLTQDANQRAGATNAIKYWTFTKYDELNRPILTGIKDTTTTAQLTQLQMQQAVDAFYAKSWTKLGEIYIGNAAGNVHGYSNKSYPVYTTAGTLDVNKYLTATYYDNYTFRSLWTGSYAYLDENLSEVQNGVTYNQPDVEFATVKGQVTGTKVKILDGGTNWLKSVTYYDDDYRAIQTIADNQTGGTDRTTTVYDFTGKPLETKSTHNALWRNHVGVSVSANSITKTIATTSWTNAGAASVKPLGAGQNGYIELTVSETTSTRMIGFSINDENQDYTTMDFSVYLNQTTLYAYERTINRGSKGTIATGDVIRLDRTGTSVKIYKNGTLLYTFPTSSATALYADCSLNSIGATLTGITLSWAPESHTVTRRMEYDHAGRLINTWHKLDGNNEILLSKNIYNELGQLIDKKLHSTLANGSDAKQSVDYRYNIRGWLTKINESDVNNSLEAGEPRDLFGMELGYNTDIGVSNTALYNGNISAIKWSNNLSLGDVKENAYTYSYDPMNRLTASTYKQKNGSWASAANNGFSETGFTYDLNGNILTLQRNDGRASNWMDNLTYNYGTGTTQSNKLLSVTDNGDDFKGFIDGTNSSSVNDYTYDANGNMITDLNKNILAALPITYNHLNLPETVSKGTSTIRYTYDATGRKLFQTVSGSGPQKQTDYLGEYVYTNGALQFVNHEEGRIAMASEESLFSFDGGNQTGITKTGTDIILTNETNNGETYLKITVAAGATKRGVSSFRTPLAVTVGDRYVYRVRGYRGGEAAALYVKGNSADIVWPGAPLPNNINIEAWVETYFTIPPGVTQIELGVMLNAANASVQNVYVNEAQLIKLGNNSTAEYQYHLKDHLGNVRLTFTTKVDATTNTATLETANAANEQSQFLRFAEARKIQSFLFDRTNGSSPTTTTGYAQRLNGSANEKYGLGKSISVMPGDVLSASVYAKYIDPVNSNWTTALSNLLSQIAAGTAPAGTVVDGGSYGSSTANFPYSTRAAENTSSSTETGPKVYLNWLVFDRNYNFIAAQSGYDRLSSAPKEAGQDVAHELLQSPQITIKQPGYVYIFLSNEETATLEAYFDDFTVTHTKSPVIQQDDYYAFGLNFNSFQRENSGGNQYLYNGKERQDELDLGWLDYGARMFMPEIGKWGVIDGKSELYFATTTYAYALNQPTNAIDPDGNLVIFINGMHSGTTGAAYWRSYSGEKEVYAFDKAVMNHVNDHKAIYRDGALGGASNTSRSKRDGNLDPEGRSNQGYKQGTEDAEMIIKNLARDKNGNITESIKIITHSMGGAYGKGYAKAILDYARKHNIAGVTIAFEADFAPFQSSSQKAVKDENMGPTLQFSHDKDKVAGNKPIDGAEQVDTDDDKDQGHSILSFVNQISKLPAGKYKVVNGQIVPLKEKEKKKKNENN